MTSNNTLKDCMAQALDERLQAVASLDLPADFHPDGDTVTVPVDYYGSNTHASAFAKQERLRTVLPVTVADGATAPTRAHPTDAGLDLYAHGDHVLDQGVSQFVDTGISTAIPEGFVGKLIARSSLYNNCNGAMLVNGVGVIDADYRGTIKAHIVTFGEGGTVILNGDKIVQLVITPVITPAVEVVDKLPATDRGTGGFGSTGK